MKKSLVSLGLATALLVPAGAAYAQSDDVAVDTTATCRALDGVAAGNAYGAQNQALLDGQAPYGDPELCPSGGEQMRLHDGERLQNGEGLRYGAQNHERLGEGEFGNSENCPDGGEQSRLMNGQGKGAGNGSGRVGF